MANFKESYEDVISRMFNEFGIILPDLEKKTTYLKGSRAFTKLIEPYIDFKDNIPKSLSIYGSAILSMERFWICFILYKISAKNLNSKKKCSLFLDIVNESTMHSIISLEEYKKFYCKKCEDLFDDIDAIERINSNPKLKPHLTVASSHKKVKMHYLYMLYRPEFFVCSYFKPLKKYLIQQDDIEEETNQETKKTLPKSEIKSKSKDEKEKEKLERDLDRLNDETEEDAISEILDKGGKKGLEKSKKNTNKKETKVKSNTKAKKTKNIKKDNKNKTVKSSKKSKNTSSNYTSQNEDYLDFLEEDEEIDDSDIDFNDSYFNDNDDMNFFDYKQFKSLKSEELTANSKSVNKEKNNEKKSKIKSVKKSGDSKKSLNEKAKTSKRNNSYYENSLSDSGEIYDDIGDILANPEVIFDDNQIRDFKIQF